MDFTGMTKQELQALLSVLLKKEAELDIHQEQLPVSATDQETDALNDIATKIRTVGEELRRRSH